MKHVIAVIVENKSGVLTRIAGLFSRRSFNIDSLSVGATDNPDYSRMTISVHGDRDTLEQVIKQLSKLINVIRVSELDPATWCAGPIRRAREFPVWWQWSRITPVRP